MNLKIILPKELNRKYKMRWLKLRKKLNRNRLQLNRLQIRKLRLNWRKSWQMRKRLLKKSKNHLNLSNRNTPNQK